MEAGRSVPDVMFGMNYERCLAAGWAEESLFAWPIPLLCCGRRFGMLLAPGDSYCSRPGLLVHGSLVR